VNMYRLKMHAFTLKGTKDQFVHGPEIFLWMRRSSQTILIGHHNQFIIQFPCDPGQKLQGSRVKTEFFKGIQLLVLWLQNERPVPVYKKQFLSDCSHYSFELIRLVTSKTVQRPDQPVIFLRC